MKRVKPQLLKGMQDAGPKLALARRRAIDAAEQVCRSFGFLPLDTPALEELDALVGNQPDKAQLDGIFHFTNQDQVDVGLRYELTGSLARLVSMSLHDLNKPLKRYQTGFVWRWDKPEPGRFREFLQFDIDTVGSPLMIADAEIIAMIGSILNALGIEGYLIRVSNRKLLNGLGEFCGAEPEKTRSIYRVIDKLDKFDRERVRLELGTGLTDESGDNISGLGLDAEQIARIDAFLDLPNDGDVDASLAAVTNLIGKNQHIEQAVSELQQVFEHITAFGIDESKVRLDLQLARGLGYYDGPVFETILMDQPGFGSIFAGGRYNGLMDRFVGVGQGLPATGASVGIDRLLAAQQAAGQLGADPGCAQVLVTVMDETHLHDYITMATELRAAGIRAELFTGKGNLGRQLKYADRLGIPLAIVAGSDEFSQGEASIKDLELGRRIAMDAESREAWKEQKQQETVSRAGLAARIKSILDRSRSG